MTFRSPPRRRHSGRGNLEFCRSAPDEGGGASPGLNPGRGGQEIPKLPIDRTRGIGRPRRLLQGASRKGDRE
jgi:hypothetical protein